MSPSSEVVVVLPFDPGNAHQRSFQKPGGRLDFRINGNLPLARRLKLRQVPGHARTDHDEFVPEERFHALRAEFQPDFILDELGQDFAKFRGRLAVGNRHHRAAARQGVSHRKPAAGQADHQYVFALDIHSMQSQASE